MGRGFEPLLMRSPIANQQRWQQSIAPCAILANAVGQHHTPNHATDSAEDAVVLTPICWRPTQCNKRKHEIDNQPSNREANHVLHLLLLGKPSRLHLLQLVDA